MPPRDEARVADTRAWLKKAATDLEAGRYELPNLALASDVVFHAQQAAEKALKAFLAWHDASLEQLVDKAAPLTEYAWRYRYPGEADAPERDEAEAALAIAQEVYEAIIDRLPVEVRP